MAINPKLNDLLSRLSHVTPQKDGSFVACCPVHESSGDGHNPSLVVSDVDGKILIKCRSQGCDVKDIVYSLSMSYRDLFAEQLNGLNGHAKPQLTATYEYRDESNALLFQKCRMEPGRDGRPKDFILRRPDGNGGFVGDIKGVRRVLYRLPDVMRAAKDVPIFVLEGEKACDRVAGFGCVTTCNFDGAGKWQKGYSDALSGRHVILVPDNDEAGENHVRVASPILSELAESFHVLRLPDSGPAWGLDDWFDRGGHSVDEFKGLLDGLEDFDASRDVVEKPKPADVTADDLIAHYRSVLESVGITYVAENPDGGIFVFSAGCKKFATLSDVSRLSYPRLAQLCGPVLATKVHEGSDDIPGMCKVKDVRNAISFVASTEMSDGEILGIGVWPGVDETLICNRGGVIVDRGGRDVTIAGHPNHHEHLYNIGTRDAWVNSEHMCGLLRGSSESSRCEAVAELTEFLSNWKFGGEERCKMYPQALAGMLLATICQTMWRWRPQVFLVGKPGSGKSLMLESLEKMLGKLAIKSSGSSAASIRISVGSSAKVPMCDELEKSRHRNDILEMIRASGRGDSVMRATSRQDVNQFALRQIFWCASTESGLTQQADQSRFLVFEIDETPTFLMPPTPDLRALGERAVVAAVRSFDAAQDILLALAKTPHEGVPARVCETYAVPVAMYAAASGMGLAGATLMLSTLIQLATSETGEIEDDHDQLLHDIVLASVSLQGGRKASVLSMLERIDYETEYREQLAIVGVSIDNDKEWVFLNKRLIQRHLLSQEWAGKRIDQILLRCSGSKRVKRKFRKGQSLNAIAIPASELIDRDEY